MGGPMSARVLAIGFVALVLIWLYVPILVIVLFSFATSPRLSLPIEGVTLEWYGKALSDPLMTTALVNSLTLAAVTATVAGVLGAAFAFGIVALKRRRLRTGLLAASVLPAIVPLLVIGIALAVFFRGLGMPQGMFNAAMGHILICMPFVILTMNARLETFDFSVLEAARDLGATPYQAFRDITLPLIRPSVLGSGLLAAALSFDEFVVTWFNIGNRLTVPVLVWGWMRRGVDPSINAIATLLLCLLIALVVTASLLTRNRKP